MMILRILIELYLVFIRYQGIFKSSEEEIGNEVTNKETKGACDYLEHDKGVAEFLFVGWAKQTEPSVDQGEVVWHTF